MGWDGEGREGLMGRRGGGVSNPEPMGGGGRGGGAKEEELFTVCSRYACQQVIDVRARVAWVKSAAVSTVTHQAQAGGKAVGRRSMTAMVEGSWRTQGQEALECMR